MERETEKQRNERNSETEQEIGKQTSEETKRERNLAQVNI
jgi:hypothetical protein